MYDDASVATESVHGVTKKKRVHQAIAGESFDKHHVLSSNKRRTYQRLRVGGGHAEVGGGVSG